MRVVYIVVFEGAYGQQIDSVFIDPVKAQEYVDKKNKSDYCYQYEIEIHFVK